MTESPAPDDPIVPVALAVRKLMPGLRRQAMVTAGLIAAIAAVSGVLTVLVASSRMEGEDRLKAGIIVVGLGASLIFLAHRWMRKRQEALVMPILAASVDLTYAKDAAAFAKQLPPRLLPSRGIRHSEDLVQGRLGVHTLQMAEVKVETGGKNSRVLFQGLVGRVPTQAPMPPFFLAQTSKTQPGMIFSGDLNTDGLYRLRSVQGADGMDYGIWTSWSALADPTPALDAVIAALLEVGTHLGQGFQLYTAMSDGTQTHIALSHQRNLFRVGGLFPDENQLFRDARAAMQDLLVPLTLARALIAAEQAAIAGSVKPS
jgi:hypothetical protein